MWEEVLGEDAVGEIYSSHSSEEEKLCSCADTYTTCKPDSSWEDLVQRLYYYDEMAAAKEAKTFLQQNGAWTIMIVRKLWGRSEHSYLRYGCEYNIFWHLAIDYIDNHTCNISLVVPTVDYNSCRTMMCYNII